jgi:hypothetical protein
MRVEMPCPFCPISEPEQKVALVAAGVALLKG